MNLEIITFITIKPIDIIDILLVAFLLFQLYHLIRGTVAVNIFIGFFLIFILYRIVKALEMQLLSDILGQFISVGMIALIIVFQPEIRDFLFYLGAPKFLSSRKGGKKRLLWWVKQLHKMPIEEIDEIVKAVNNMSKNKTGALIVIAGESELIKYAQTGIQIDAKISSRLLENIFFKNSPLHDGAVIISDNKIKAAAVVLPLSTTKNFPEHLGLRHRAGLGITEFTDAIAIIVSEQTGSISFCKKDMIKYNVPPEKIQELLMKHYEYID